MPHLSLQVGQHAALLAEHSDAARRHAAFDFVTRNLEFTLSAALRGTLPYLTLPYLTLPYPTLPYLTLPYPTLPYTTLPYLT